MTFRTGQATAPATAHTPTSVVIRCSYCQAYLHFSIPAGQHVDEVHLDRITRGLRVHYLIACGTD